jgi:hypothetical protein
VLLGFEYIMLIICYHGAGSGLILWFDMKLLERVAAATFFPEIGNRPDERR